MNYDALHFCIDKQFDYNTLHNITGDYTVMKRTARAKAMRDWMGSFTVLMAIHAVESYPQMYRFRNGW